MDLTTHPHPAATLHRACDGDPTVVTTVLGVGRQSATEARHLLRSTLGRCNLSELAADAELALSEVVTNVWRHTTACVVPITIRCDGDAVEVCVANTSAAYATTDSARRGAPGEGGFGLRIVEALADSCGWQRTPVGVAYRFTVTRRGTHTRP